MAKKIVLAYSGGLDTSCAVKWLKDKGFEVICFIANLGQVEGLKKIEKRALVAGATKVYIKDLQQEFINSFIFPTLKANAVYEGKYSLATALGRPLIAKYLVEVAHRENASYVAHGCTGKGNDQVRFDITIKALNPALRVIAPVREWKFDRAGQIKWAQEHDVPVPVTADSPYSVDENLWGRSIEGGMLEHPDTEVPEDVWDWTADIMNTPDEPEYIKIGFNEGVPVSLDGVQYKPQALIKKVRDIAGKHGVGRIEHMEDRIVGLKTRETYEIPAAETIINAHLDLEKMVLTRHQKLLKMEIDHKWATAVYQGLWVDPYKEDLDAYINSTQKNVMGTVTMKIHKGSAKPVSRESPLSLYDYNLASFDINTHYDQGDAVGFINLWGLPSVTAWNLKRKIAETGLKKQGKKIVPVPTGYD